MRRIALATLAVLGCGEQTQLAQGPLTPLEFSSPFAFGSVLVGAASERGVVLRNPNGVDVVVQAAPLAEASEFGAVEPSVVVPARGEAELDIRFAPQALGDTEGLVTLTYPDNEGQLRLLGTGFDTNVRVFADVIDFGTVLPGIDVVLEPDIVSTVPEPVSVRLAEDVARPFSVESLQVVLDPFGASNLSARFDAPRVDEGEAFRSTLRVLSLGSLQDEITVPLTAFVEPRPLQCDNRVDLGLFDDARRTAESVLRCENVTAYPLAVERTGELSAGWAVDLPTMFRVDPRERFEVEARFVAGLFPRVGPANTRLRMTVRAVDLATQGLLGAEVELAATVESF